MKNQHEKLLYQRLLDGDRTAIEEIYELYKVEFLNFFKKYNINDESILDIYQDTIIVVYQKFVQQNIKLNSSILKTYIFGIGKNKMYDYFKRKQISSNAIDKLKDTNKDFEIENEPSIYQKKLAENLKLLSESCQNILKLFYYRGLSIKEIVLQTSYKDENTVKSNKSRCLKRLRDLCKK